MDSPSQKRRIALCPACDVRAVETKNEANEPRCRECSITERGAMKGQRTCPDHGRVMEKHQLGETGVVADVCASGCVFLPSAERRALGRKLVADNSLPSAADLFAIFET